MLPVTTTTTNTTSTSNQRTMSMSMSMSSLELFLSDEEATVDCDLPKDIILDILSRLPVPSLLRFKSVCKSCPALISNPTFIAKHHNRALTFDERLIVHTYDVKRSVSLIKRNERRVDLEIPDVCDASGFLRLVGSCNGLVCVSLCAGGSVVVLWNPATREVRRVPEPQVSVVPDGSKRVCDSAVFIGFGFVPETGDYKIVRFLSYKVVGTHVPKVGVVEVYSKICDAWKEVQNPGLKCLINDFSHTAVVSGRVHWLGTRVARGKGKDVIVLFDLGREVFGDMPLPESAVYAEGYGWQISLFGESLAVLVFPIRGSMSESADVWVMKEYGIAESWSKQFSIGLYTGTSQPVGCFKNAEMILRNREGTLFLYNPRTMKFGPFSLCNAKYVYSVHSYAESLVSVKGGI